MNRWIEARSHLLLWLVSTIERRPVEDSALGRTWISPSGVASQQRSPPDHLGIGSWINRHGINFFLYG